MPKQKDLKIKTPKYAEKIHTINTFACGFVEEADTVFISFGEWQENSRDKFIVEKTRIIFPIEMVKALILDLVESGIEYQEKTGKNIGFPKSVKKEDGK